MLGFINSETSGFVWQFTCKKWMECRKTVEFSDGLTCMIDISSQIKSDKSIQLCIFHELFLLLKVQSWNVQITRFNNKVREKGGKGFEVFTNHALSIPPAFLKCLLRACDALCWIWRIGKISTHGPCSKTRNSG